MANRAGHREKVGFTLLEVLISLAIFLMVFFGVYQVFDANWMTYQTGQMKLDAQQTARLALNEIVRRIRMAGYYPEQFDPDGTTTTSLASPIPVLVGTESALIVYGDLEETCPNPSQAACPANSSRIYLYCRSGSTLIRKTSTDPTVDPSFACSGGETLADNITALRFAYYDANGNIVPAGAGTSYQLDGQAVGVVPSLAAGTTTQRLAVRSILVSLTAQETSPGQRAQSYTVTSTVRLRNVN